MIPVCPLPFCPSEFILRELTDYSRIICYSLSYLLFFFYSGHNVVSKKGPWAVHITSCSDMGGGRIFVTLLHFTTKKPPCLHYHNYITTGYCKPTHPPSTSLIQFSVCISQACVASHKWTSAGVLTFQEKDSKFRHAMKANQNFSQAATVTFRYCISPIS